MAEIYGIYTKDILEVKEMDGRYTTTRNIYGTGHIRAIYGEAREIYGNIRKISEIYET